VDAVIYQFPQEQVLIAKPTPCAGGTSCSTAMLRRGNQLAVPDFGKLAVNTDDDAIVGLLSRLLGILENRTEVAIEHSRESYDANVKHPYYYLFQKQGLVANKDQLFAARMNLSNRKQSGTRCRSSSGSHPTIDTNSKPNSAWPSGS
jgi:hypothetical protein